MWVEHRVPLGPKLHLRLEALPGPQVLTARPTPEADILSRPSTSPPKNRGRLLVDPNDHEPGGGLRADGCDRPGYPCARHEHLRVCRA